MIRLFISIYITNYLNSGVLYKDTILYLNIWLITENND